MTDKEIKVGFIQHKNQGSTADNLDYIGKEISTMAKLNTHLIVLQELHNSAYFCQEENTDNFDLAEKIKGQTFQYLSKFAKEFKLVIVGSIFEKRAEGIYHNTAIVIDNDGSLAGFYRKMHIPDDPGFQEKFYFTPGDHLSPAFKPVQTSIGSLGVLICWDQWYPEAARLMALAGADILIYPTAIGWDLNDSLEEQLRQLQAWQTIQRGHAIANHLPVIACNRMGFEAAPSTDNRPQQNGIKFWGNSFIAGPQGEILLEANDEMPASLQCSINLESSARLRKIWPFFRDRRIDAYNDLTKRYIDQ